VHDARVLPFTLNVIFVILPGDTLAFPATDTLLPLTVAPAFGEVILTDGFGGGTMYQVALFDAGLHG
jgi:hypothetical protein